MVGIEGEHRMPSDGLSRDVAIIHLTDLHFCPGLTRPAWETQILRAFEKLVSANNIEVFGVAVTGDLVDQPGPEAFRAVKEFLVESAERLGIKREGNIDWGRIWLVDGNHDYRWYGMLARKYSRGIEEGGLLKRLEEPYADEEGRFLVFGINSGRQGKVARGNIEIEALRKLQDGYRRSQKVRVTKDFHYRVALVHHHLLPLPDRPQEFIGGLGDKISSATYDEAFKLLKNAGLATDILLEASVDLVLHGHEHKEFAASVKYHDRHSAGHVMAVVGGPAAPKG
jgi:hypothetical protein